MLQAQTLEDIILINESSPPGTKILISEELYTRWCKSGRFLTDGKTFKIVRSESDLIGIVPRSPLDVQISGDHYKSLPIQPVEYIHANKIPFIEGNVIKYVTRWRDKGGIKDLEKAKHFIDLLIELESRASPKVPVSK